LSEPGKRAQAFEITKMLIMSTQSKCMQLHALNQSKSHVAFDQIKRKFCAVWNLKRWCGKPAAAVSRRLSQAWDDSISNRFRQS